MGFLPVFRGYTVDARLREFRKVDRRMSCGNPFSIKFIPFDSPEGERLLKAWLRRRAR